MKVEFYEAKVKWNGEGGIHAKSKDFEDFKVENFGWHGHMWLRML